MKGSEARDERRSATISSLFAGFFCTPALAALPFGMKLARQFAYKRLVFIEFQWLVGSGVEDKVVGPSLGARQIVPRQSESLSQHALEAVSFDGAPDTTADGES